MPDSRLFASARDHCAGATSINRRRSSHGLPQGTCLRCSSDLWEVRSLAKQHAARSQDPFASNTFRDRLRPIAARRRPETTGAPPSRNPSPRPEPRRYTGCRPSRNSSLPEERFPREPRHRHTQIDARHKFDRNIRAAPAYARCSPSAGPERCVPTAHQMHSRSRSTRTRSPGQRAMQLRSKLRHRLIAQTLVGNTACERPASVRVLPTPGNLDDVTFASLRSVSNVPGLLSSSLATDLRARSRQFPGEATPATSPAHGRKSMRSGAASALVSRPRRQGTLHRTSGRAACPRRTSR